MNRLMGPHGAVRLLWGPASFAFLIGSVFVTNALLGGYRTDESAILGGLMWLAPVVEWAIYRRLGDFMVQVRVTADSFDETWSNIGSRIVRVEDRVQSLEAWREELKRIADKGAAQ
jgi:hypothetical protein